MEFNEELLWNSVIRTRNEMSFSLPPTCQGWTYWLWSEGPKMEDCDRGLNYKFYPLTLIYFLFVSSCSSIQSRISFIFFTLQKDVILVDLTVWIGRKEYIGNKCKLKDWNEKKKRYLKDWIENMPKLEGVICNLTNKKGIYNATCMITSIINSVPKIQIEDLSGWFRQKGLNSMLVNQFCPPKKRF